MKNNMILTYSLWILCLWGGACSQTYAADGPAAVAQPQNAVWDGNRAMGYIAKQLSFGSRALNTPGHQKTIEFIVKELAGTSATIDRQEWAYQGSGGDVYTLTNIIARFDPANPRRMIIGTHYDSIGRAYLDPQTPDALMPGANNSASGVALLLETARMLSSSPQHPLLGIDLVFFDGEEGPYSLGAGDSHWVALGSPYFADHIHELYPKKAPEQGIIFDMVCYQNLKLYPERFSMASAGAEVKKFWDIGQVIAPSVFLRKSTLTPIADDQNALAAIGVPSFLVIGFDYAPWFNTTKDTIDKCSAASLEAVGRTLVHYIFL